MRPDFWHRRSTAMILSTICALIVLFIKAEAYSKTDSQAIFADFMESLLHIGMVAIASISIWYAARPPDREHTFGHGKAAYFSATLEGILVLLTGGGILYNSFLNLYKGEGIHNISLGIALVIVVIAVNGALSGYLLKIGKKKANTVLVSHGYHVLTDTWTSIGVLLSLLATSLTGLIWIDSMVGAILAMWILYTGGKVCLQAFQGLMERIDENADAKIIMILNAAVDKELIYDYHKLRHRCINDQLWIEIHLLFEGNLPLRQAHDRATALELQMIEAFPRHTVYIITHLEPKAHQSAHPANHPDR